MIVLKLFINKFFLNKSNIFYLFDMSTFTKFLQKLFCCSKSTKVELKVEKDLGSLSDRKQLLLIDEQLKSFTFNGSVFFLTKNTAVLPKACLIKNLHESAYDNEYDINNDAYPDEYKLADILPPKTDTLPTIVLDLDHTLIFPSAVPLENYDFTKKIKYKGKIIKMYFVKRPFLTKFLEEVSKHFEVIVYTAGILQYGIKIIKHIDHNNHIKYCLGRKYCTVLTKNGHTKDLYVKNLEILGRDLKKTILIDDRDYSFALHQKNGLLIPGFHGDKNDTCLEELKNYLVKIKDTADYQIRDKFTFEIKK
ncbi:hypothetical protein NUSPORA_01965 [Nucleospora cyclopteri]